MRQYENKKIKLNAPLRGHAAGAQVNIKVDKDGVPKERYWRDRFKDARTDKCVEFASSGGRHKSEPKVIKPENKEIGGKD